MPPPARAREASICSSSVTITGTARVPQPAGADRDLRLRGWPPLHESRSLQPQWQGRRRRWYLVGSDLAAESARRPAPQRQQTRNFMLLQKPPGRPPAGGRPGSGSRWWQPRPRQTGHGHRGGRRLSQRAPAAPAPGTRPTVTGRPGGGHREAAAAAGFKLAGVGRGHESSGRRDHAGPRPATQRSRLGP